MKTEGPAVDVPRDVSDLIETVDCPACGSNRFSPVTGLIADEESEDLEEPFRSMRFQMVQCCDCEIVYLRERPTQKEIGRFYEGEYCCYEPIENRGLIVRALATLVTWMQVRSLKRLFPPGSDLLLDHGCGTGIWLAALKRARVPWKLIGTEISPELVEKIRARGLTAFVCDDSTLADHIQPASLGVVMMNHVIEHVPDPKRTLRTMFDLLVPGGVILGQTPNWLCPEQRFLGDLWPQWHVPRHMILFSPSTLRAVAESSGLEVVSIRSSPSAATQWSGGVLKLLARNRGRRFRGIHEPLYPYLMLAFAPISFLQSLVGNTSHMDFVLRKPATEELP